MGSAPLKPPMITLRLVGLFLYGKRVIQMMGSRVTRRMTSSMGFCVEWVAAVTVLIARFRVTKG